MTDISTLSFLFWNVHKKHHNIQLAFEHAKFKKIDVIILCEMPVTSIMAPEEYYQIEHVSNDCVELGVFVKADHCNTSKTYFREKSRFCSCRLDMYHINLIVMHLNSSLYPTAKETRLSDINIALSDINQIEQRYLDKRTLIVGDLNMDPWAEEMFYQTGLNARLFKFQTSIGSSRIHEHEADVFYNPMLHVFRDRSSDNEPCGTYFYASSQPQWHCYDHILMKQELVNDFDISKLAVLSKLGNTQLMKNYKPDFYFSDHLPVYFEFKSKEDYSHGN